MARQLNVNLVFNANTTQAKQQMAGLQTSMHQVTNALNSQVSMSGLTAELGKAQTAVINLKSNLNSAFDVNTGKLDLTKFNNNLTQSGMKLKDYRVALQQLGPEGQRAFNQLTQAIVQGQMPIQKTKNLLTTMMDTFGNSIKWSIAYGAINKISQGIQEAFQYAKDLDKSLTSIRVVTGYSRDEMAQFAEKANQAAKALSTTTTAYTDAALIYYQQGLDGKAVEERVETTLKLANATGQSAQTISQQLTAVWNNFYDGTKSLEYYADVMAALGAATASSSDEIAQGLEKFAAVADTVGLSFEYATTALATVTAQTRQSADVVGTAFKTLWARMQDLQLGNTLEDGTTLGKYSEAMLKVGVNIKDATGQLKDMDTVLVEMGEKWKQLEADEQVALAKAVGGIRQYNQLIALMDNWDTFEINLAIAENAEGTLQEQQNRWADSWEAASKRVSAAGEDVYNSLINDEFFINLNNVFADLLSGLDEFLEAIGGLRTLLPLVAGWMMKAFGPAALGAIQGFTAGLMGPSVQQQAQAGALRNEALQQQGIMNAEAGNSGASSAASENTLRLLESIQSIKRHLSQSEIETLQILIDQNQQYADMLMQLGQIVDQIDAMNTKLKGDARSLSRESMVAEAGLREEWNAAGNADKGKKFDQIMARETDRMARAGQGQIAIDTFNEAEVMGDKGFDPNMARSNLAALESGLRDAGQLTTSGLGADLANFDGTAEGYDKIISKTKDLNLITTNADKSLESMRKEFTSMGVTSKKATDGLVKWNKNQEELTENTRQQASTVRKNQKAQQAMTKTQDNYNQSIDASIAKTKAMAKLPLGQTLTALAGSLGMAASGLSMMYGGLESLKQMFEDGEHTISGWLGVITGLGMGFMILKSTLDGLKVSIGTILAENVANNGAMLTSNLLLMQKNKLTTDQIGCLVGLKMAQALENGETEESVLALGAELLMKKAGMSQDQASIVSSMLLKGAKDKETKARWANVAAMVAEKVAAGPVMWIIMAILAAVALVTAGFIALFSFLASTTAEAKLAAEKAQLEEMNKALGEMKARYDEIKEALEDYTNAQKTLDTMIKGTKEWNEAVFELNQQVIDLMDKYPTLAKYLISKNGVLGITKEGLKAVEQKAADDVATQTTAVMAQKIKVATAQQALDWKNFQSDQQEYDTHSSGDTTYTDNYRYVTNTGAEVKLGDTSASYDKFFNDMKALYDEFGEELYNEDNEAVTEAIDGLGETYATAWETIKTDANFQGMLNGFTSLEVEIRNLAKVIASSELVNSDIYQNSDYQAAIEAQYSTAVADAIADGVYTKADGTEITRESWMKNLISGYDSSDSYNGDVQSDENIRKAGLQGINSQEDLAKWIVSRKTGYSTEDIGQGGSYKVEIDEIGGDTLKYKTPDGEWESVDYEEFDDAIWGEYITQQENDRIKEMDDKAYVYGDALKASGITDQSVVSGLVTDFVEGNTLDLSGLSRKEINAIDFDAIDTGNADDTAKLQNAMVTAVREYEKARTEANKQASLTWIENTREREAEDLSKMLSLAELTQDDFDDMVNNIAALKGVTKDTATEIAKDSLRASNGLNAINKVINDQKEALLSGDRSRGDFVKALNEISTAAEEWLGVKLDDDTLQQFIVDGTFAQALEQDAAAIERIQQAAAKQIVLDMDIEGIEVNGINIFDYLNQKIDEISNKDITVGAYLDDENFINTLNDMLASGQITAEQASKYLNSIGYDPQIETVSKPTTQTYTISGSGLVGSIMGEQTVTVDANVEVPVINAKGTTYTGHTAPTHTPTSSKSKTSKKDFKTADDEIERYHAITRETERLSDSLSALSEAKDRAFGPNKIALMDAEIQKTKELLSANQKYQKEIEANYQKDRTKLLDNYNVKLNTEGEISNYDEVFQNELDRYNAGVIAYNEGRITDEEFAKYEERFEQFETDIENYEDSLDKQRDAKLTEQEYKNQLADLNLEKIDYKITMQVEMNEDEMARIDFAMQTIEDDAFAAAEKIGLLTDKADATVSNIEATEAGIQAIMADIAANGGEMTADQVDKLRELRDNMADYNAELLEVRNTIQESLTEAYDAWNEKMDESISYIDHLSSMVDSYQNIVDIVGKDNLGLSDETMASMRATKQQTANDRAAAAKDKLDANEAQLARAQKALAEATTEDDKKYWEEQVKYAQEQVMSAESEFMDAWSNALQVAADNFAANVQTIADAFSESVSGVYKNLEEMSEAFDRQKEISERYLEDYEKSYEISKLNRKIQQDLAKTDSAASSKALRDLQEELLALGEEGVDVSERDIEYMQKKYDLLLAEQALKDAQNAKSVVRLQQDSEGNYGYVYTADQQQTDQAQQNYEDKLFALQSYNEQVLLESQEQILAVNQEFQDAMLAIQENANLSNEEKKAKMEELTQYYTEKLGYWESEADKFLQYNRESAAQFTLGYGEETTTIDSLTGVMVDEYGNKINVMRTTTGEWVDEYGNKINEIDAQNIIASNSWNDMSLSFNDTLLGKMNPDMTSFKEHGENCYEAMNQAGEDFIDAVEQYEEDNRDATEAAGQDYDDLDEKVSEDLQNIQVESSKTANAVDDMKDDMNQDLADVTRKVQSFQNEYSKQMANIRSATNTTITNINTLIETYNNLAKAAKQDFTPDLSGTGSNGNANLPGGGGSGSSNGSSNNSGTGNNNSVTIPKTLVEGKTMINGRGYVKVNGLWYTGNASIEGYDYNKIATGQEVTLTSNASKYAMTDAEKTKVETILGKIGKTGEIVHNGANKEMPINFYKDVDKGFKNPYKYKPPNGNYGNVTVKDVAWYNGYVYVQVEDEGVNNCNLNGDDSDKTWMPARYLDFDNDDERDYPAYDTGGYTGEWGPEGRLAMLHQKEIVLNAHDTENLLSIISMVRDMNDRIELNARAMQYGLTAAYSASNIKSQNDTLQQEVHITAEFPNVTNHSEIEEAFRNLNNLASQYANRKF